MGTKSFFIVAATFLQVLGIVAIPFIVKLKNNKKKKKDAKKALFKNLMVYIKPEHCPSIEWVTSLNLIDIICQDNQKIREAWKCFREFLDHPIEYSQKFYSLRITLLSEIDKSLDYKDLAASGQNNYYVSQQMKQNYQNSETAYQLVASLKKTFHQQRFNTSNPLLQSQRVMLFE